MQNGYVPAKLVQDDACTPSRALGDLEIWCLVKHNVERINHVKMLWYAQRLKIPRATLLHCLGFRHH